MPKLEILKQPGTMSFGTYCRVERKAGGIGCTDREFVRAALSDDFLTKEGRGREYRVWRHGWLRSGLEHLRAARKLYV